MFARDRQARITELLAEHSSVTVAELSETLEVTGETIRRDLAALERRGRLDRVHGGAVLRTRSTAERPLDDRDGSNTAAKQAIAELTAQLLDDEDIGSVFLDAGSSTAALARILIERRTDPAAQPTVITHAAPIAAMLGSRIPVQLLGGRVRGLTGAAVGVDTVTAVRRLRPDVAVIGTNGLSAGFGLSTPDAEEAAVKSAAVESARRVIVVADASKFDEEALVSFAGLDDIDTVVSDAAPAGELASALAEAAVEVVLP